ncbi:MAG TPA: Lrp/AsnC family transcriptional regulator [Marinobacterium sp.]|nr:Lrp/AsnC family transcriptional regulator [Marinobacterium sp.]
MHKLDRIDRKILELLQQDARINIADLAEHVGLSQTPCGRRVKQLEERGLIARQIVVLDPVKIGLPMSVMVQMSLEKQTKDRLRIFEESIARIPEVMECYLITGSQSDYILKIVTKDLEHYQQILLDKLTAIEGVSSIITNFIIRQPISKTAYDLNHIA